MILPNHLDDDTVVTVTVKRSGIVLTTQVATGTNGDGVYRVARALRTLRSVATQQLAAELAESAASDDTSGCSVSQRGLR